MYAENVVDTLDLSGKKLKKLNKPTLSESQVITTLILDDNELLRLDIIDSYTKLQKLSAVRNQLLRMYGVCRLHSLHTLNLARNGILTIEGLKELVSLKCLCLAKNKIKTIEHLNTNVNLEHLDLSENSITHVSDLSFLKNLKELLLHNNKIGHLRQCDRFLPSSIVTLTIASNNIIDLNEISQLVNLTNLHSISLANNPCVNMTGNKCGFDYRPFVINWCMNVQIIDGYVVDGIESLRGEWLYSQGRGRHFRVGNQEELSQYLASVCPLSGEQLETEDDRKLRLILSKAQHHQQQLREQSESPMPSPVTRKKLHGSRYSPRINSSRLSSKFNKSPDRMSTSCYNPSSLSETSSLMSQSLDPSLLNESIETPVRQFSMKELNGTYEKNLDESEGINSPLHALSKLVPVPESLMSPDYRPPPAAIGSRSIPTSVPVPSRVTPSKLVQPSKSPKVVRNSHIVKPKTSVLGTVENKRANNAASPVQQRKLQQNHEVPLKSSLKKSPSSEDESEMCDAKLQSIQMKVQEKLNKDSEQQVSESKAAEQAAIFIQKVWRGYHVRNKDKDVQEAYQNLRAQRAEEYLQKLATDMESTKAALESERKIQMLQMQAIKTLWKKVSTIQPEGNEAFGYSMPNMPNIGQLNNAEVVKDLAQTCSVLQSQIQQLQGSMQDIVKFMSAFSQIPSVNQQLRESAAATQTEIIAVHTPQGESSKVFPFNKHQARPSSLPLPISQRNNKKEEPAKVAASSELQNFANTLVDGVIKTVSESKEDCLGKDTTEITVTDTDKGQVTEEKSS